MLTQQNLTTQLAEAPAHVGTGDLPVQRSSRPATLRSAPRKRKLLRPLESRVSVFPQLTQFADFGILLLRLMVGVVFITSGWNHLRDPEARSKSIGLNKNLTILVGAGEVLGSLGTIFGVLTQLAALFLILIMLGAIYKKIFVWHTGFWGEKTYGWHYDLMFIVMNLVIIFTNGRRFKLLN